MVMAAGAISLGLRRVGEPGPALAFLLIAFLSYAEVLVGEVAALISWRRGYWAQLGSWPARLGVFAFSAASTVVAELARGAGWLAAATALTILGAATALGWGAVVVGARRGVGWLGEGGALWLLGPVSLLAASSGLGTLAIRSSSWGRPLALLQLVLLGLGLAAYLPLAAALLWRLRRRPPLGTLGPSYWIVAGAPALAGLASSLAATAAGGRWPLAAPPLTFASAALLALAAALAALPATLTALRLRRRHSIAGHPPEYWSGVFPLAIISLAGLQMGPGWLAWVARLVLAVAVAAFLGDLGRAALARLLPGDSPAAGPPHRAGGPQ